jgi:two-component system, OmpR family, KDP operon response regulator KdpE
MNNHRILIVDDEPAVRKFLRNCLEGAGYHVLEAATGQSAVEATRREHPDLLVLDLGLPDLEGLEVAQILREWCETPIVVLSVRDQEQDIVASLDAGADDYLTKPFGVSELLARIRAALRRNARIAQSDPVFISGPLEVDLDSRTVRVEGEEKQLTPTEYDLLKTFVQDAGRVLTHRHLLHRVWGRGYEDDLQILRVNVSNLRRKVEPDPKVPRLLVTEPGVGYRLKTL